MPTGSPRIATGVVLDVKVETETIRVQLDRAAKRRLFDQTAMVDVAELGLNGQIAWFRFLAESGASEVVNDGAGLAVVTGLASNSDNGIVVDRETLRDSRSVRRLIDHVLECNVPASLVLSEPVSPRELRVLLDLGLTAENGANDMGKAIRGRPRVAPPDDVEIAEVHDANSLLRGLRALGDDWFDESECLARMTCYQRLGFGPGHRLRHWIALRAGHVIAMATSFRFDQSVVLMHCGVIEPERRRGVASALTAARMGAAFDDGATNAVLSPSPDGFELHRQLGFRLEPLPPNRWFYLPVVRCPARAPHDARS